SNPEIFGRSLLLKATQTIFQKLCVDIEQPPQSIARTIVEAQPEDPFRASYDFINKKAGPALEIGVLEPYQLIAETIRQAVSIVKTVLTCESTITRHPTKWYKPWKEKMQSMPHLRY